MNDSGMFVWLLIVGMLLLGLGFYYGALYDSFSPDSGADALNVSAAPVLCSQEVEEVLEPEVFVFHAADCVQHDFDVWCRWSP